MVTGLVILLALTSPARGGEASDARALGVVRVVRGRVLAREARESSVAARSGGLVKSGTMIETAADGWSEVFLLGVGRVRISAATRVVFDESGIALSGGRVWIQRAEQLGRAHFLVTVPSAVIEPERSSSVIVDHTRSAGTSIVVREGVVSIAHVAVADQPMRIGAHNIITFANDAKVQPRGKSGGSAMADLVELEADARLGDLIGVRAFLLDHAAKSEMKRSATRTTGEIVRSAPEISGGDPATTRLESAIKTPAFFEEEVPPRGPNVRVEVTFGDE